MQKNEKILSCDMNDEIDETSQRLCESEFQSLDEMKDSLNLETTTEHKPLGV